MPSLILILSNRIYGNNVLSGLGPANTRYKRALDAILKQRSGRRNFVQSSSLSESDSSELSEIFWGAVSAAGFPDELLDAPLTESLPQPPEEQEGEAGWEDHVAEPPKKLPKQGLEVAASTWNDFLATVD